jgi:small subunit ribosomal protein S6
MRGKRRLAYPIAKHKEGIYVQLTHNGDGQQVAALERAMRLSEDVIRYLTVKYEGQHSSLGRSTTPVAPMESSAPRQDRELVGAAAAIPAASDDD